MAISVGGNALILSDREGFERVLPVPGSSAGTTDWQEVLEAARMLERGLCTPTRTTVVASTHRVYIHFMHNHGWYCQFLESDLKTPLRVRVAIATACRQRRGSS